MCFTNGKSYKKFGLRKCQCLFNFIVNLDDNVNINVDAMPMPISMTISIIVSFSLLDSLPKCWQINPLILALKYKTDTSKHLPKGAECSKYSIYVWSQEGIYWLSR